MPKGTLEIKRKIKSVTNTKKVTKAMELIAATKMRRAVGSVLATRPYAKQAWNMIRSLASRVDNSLHPLLEQRPIKRVAVIVVSSNRGLCGGFNNNIVSQTLRLIKEQPSGATVDAITLGKKGRDTLSKSAVSVVADFVKNDITTSIMDIASASHMAVKGYRDGTYDKVVVIYTDYISSLRQRPKVHQLLPMQQFMDANLGTTVEGKKEAVEKEAVHEFTFEPSPDEVLEVMLPRLLEMQLFQAVLESEASEHSSRMIAMKNASEAATDMLFDLSLTFNQARQAGITQEIAEISAGRAALE